MKTQTNHHVWDDFNDVSKRLEPYLEIKGQGTTMASQVAACISNLVYHFFNDGDIFDTTHHLTTSCTDFSSRANWLYLNQPATRPILDRIEKVPMANMRTSFSTCVKSMMRTPSLLSQRNLPRKTSTTPSASSPAPSRKMMMMNPQKIGPRNSKAVNSICKGDPNHVQKNFYFSQRVERSQGKR